MPSMRNFVLSMGISALFVGKCPAALSVAPPARVSYVVAYAEETAGRPLDWEELGFGGARKLTVDADTWASYEAAAWQAYGGNDTLVPRAALDSRAGLEMFFCHESGSWAKSVVIDSVIKRICKTFSYRVAQGTKQIVEWRNGPDEQRLKNSAGDSMSLMTEFTQGVTKDTIEDTCVFALQELYKKGCHGRNADTRGGRVRVMGGGARKRWTLERRALERATFGIDPQTDNCRC